MPDHTERVRDARERLLEIATTAGLRYMGETARFAEQLDAYAAAVRRATLAEVREKVERFKEDGCGCGCDADDHADVFNDILANLTQLEATDGR